ncbi:MAG: M48 family metalloprotease [Gammaproteobacteria bacterium]
MGTRLLVITLLAFVFAAQAYSALLTNAWDVKELAKSNDNQVELRDRRGTLVKRVDTQQIRYLYTVKTSMERVAEIQTKLVIVDGKQPNAFAAKGNGGENIVAINVAMLDVLGMDIHAAAALIGHELAHLRLKHGEHRKVQASSTEFMKILGGAALTGMGIPAGQLISNLTFTAINTKYSRDDEREADYLGAIWAVEAGYEVDGAVRLQEEVYRQSRSSPVPFLSSHPSGPERIATLKSLARRLSR